MIIPPAYLPSNTPSQYILLINFSKNEPGSEFIEKYKNELINALNSIQRMDISIQNLLPLIYFSAKKNGLFEQLNTEAQKHLHENGLKLVAYEKLKLSRLEATLELLNNNDIPVILLKGAALNQNIYDSDVPRASSDIDILVKQSDFNRCKQLLDQHSMFNRNIKNDINVFDTIFECSYSTSPPISITLDLHEFLTHPKIFNIAETTLWQLSNQHPAYNSNKVRILSPEHTLLHLAIHAFRDQNFCTHSLLDAHEIITNKPVDSEILVEGARSWGAKHILYCLLVNCATGMQTVIEPGLLKKIRPPAIKEKLFKKLLNSKVEGYINKSWKQRPRQIAGILVFPDSLRQGLRLIKYYLLEKYKWQTKT